MKSVFGERYATAYDAIYASKDYRAESEALVRVGTRNGLPPNTSILDYGCGTGRHASVLSEMGYSVVGTDRSEEMLAIARSRYGRTVSFVGLEDLSKLEGSFDLVMSVFDVLSYSVDVEGMTEFFRRLSRMARPNGLVIVDSWHLPGLWNDPPQTRTMNFSLADGREIVRTATPVFNRVTGVTSIQYEIEERGNNAATFTEEHILRAFTELELVLLARQAGLEPVETLAAPDLTGDVLPSSWHIALIARRAK